MEKEVSSAVNLSVMLIAMTVVLSMVMYTVYVGNGLKSYLIEDAVQMQEGIATGQLNSLSGGDPKIMPKSSIYYILTKEYTGVRSLYYEYEDADGNAMGGMHTVNGKGYWAVDGSITAEKQFLFPADAINENSLDGKVLVDIERLDRGQYNITITDVNIHE